MTRTKNQTVGNFVLNNDAVYPWMVYAWVPKPDGSGKVKTKFQVEFKHASPERRLELLDEFRDRLRQREALESQNLGELSDDEANIMRDGVSFEQTLLNDVVVRFLKHVVDRDGNDISQNEGTKEAMLRNAWARDALLAAYQISLQGRNPEGN